MPPDRDPGGARAVDDAPDLADLLPDDLQGVEQRGADHDGGPVLVVVKDRDIADLLESPFDLETPGRRDIFEVDAAERARDVIDGLDQLVDVLGLHADREGVDVGKRFEQGAFPLHHRHPGFGSDVAQPEDRGPVGDDRHQVRAAGQGIGEFGILLDGEAGFRHARRVRDRKVVPVVDPDPRDHLDLASPFFVRFQRFLSDGHNAPPVFFLGTV